MCLDGPHCLATSAWRVFAIFAIFNFGPLCYFVTKGTIILVNIRSDDSIFFVNLALLVSFDLRNHHSLNHLLIKTGNAFRIIFWWKEDFICFLRAALADHARFHSTEDWTVFTQTLPDHLVVQADIVKVFFLGLESDATQSICDLDSLFECLPVCLLLTPITVINLNPTNLKVQVFVGQTCINLNLRVCFHRSKAALEAFEFVLWAS